MDDDSSVRLTAPTIRVRYVHVVAKSLKDLDQWTTEADWPRTPCPLCVVGSVGFGKSEHQLDSGSKNVLDLAHRNLGPHDELSGTFAGTLVCDSSTCRQELAIAGDWAYTWDTDNLDSYGNPPFSDMYRVRYVNPPMPLLIAPERTPANVTDEITGASIILFINPSAAGSRLRRAVEELMNAQRVKKTRIDTKSKKRIPMSLHQRIIAFGANRPDIAEVLLAVKWIGNEATHGKQLTVSDVVLCAEVLEAALVSLYDRRDAELKALTRSINRRKGLGRRRAV